MKIRTNKKLAKKLWMEMMLIPIHLNPTNEQREQLHQIQDDLLNSPKNIQSEKILNSIWRKAIKNRDHNPWSDTPWDNGPGSQKGWFSVQWFKHNIKTLRKAGVLSGRRLNKLRRAGLLED